MGLINTEIPEAAYELLRDRIGEILASELETQAYITSDPVYEAFVWVERWVPFSHTHLPAVNVSLIRGTYEGQSVVQVDGYYRFAIECYTSAKSSESDKGDSLATFKLHKLMRACRAILMNPKYVRLGFEPPFVMNRNIEDMLIADPGKQDAVSVMRGRFTLVVRVPENTELITPELVYGMETRVRLAETDSGYVYLNFDNPPDPSIFDYTFDDTYE